MGVCLFGEGKGGEEGFRGHVAQVHGAVLVGEAEDEWLEGGEVGECLLVFEVLH